MIRECEICSFPLTRKQIKTCSRECQAELFRRAYRGRGKSPYIQIRNENGEREYLHRYIFRTKVRPLRNGEIVHHKNENKRDNSVNNLEAISGRAAHLHEHNYWRKPLQSSEEDFKTFGW